ncbi:protein TOPAZ1 [Dryobates pubescens]|uniref:protein TOPAZ1 n=1 Tax=Dryobates pubescens TaxID=118200 RepID=UPI0023BA0735|nr:protein TOPAZ1 [Dryobates pubescens]
MPQLRSGKVVTGSKVKSSAWMVTTPGSLTAGVEHDLVKNHVVKKSPHLAPKRKSEQPFSSCLQPAILSSISCEQCASLAPMQKEQGDSSQGPADEKTQGNQCERTARSDEGVALPISHAALCKDWQTVTMAAAASWEEHLTRGTGQGEQLFFLVPTLQSKFSAEIEREEHTSEGLNLSSFQDSSGSSGNTEIKLQMSSSEEELESTESHGIACLPKPEVLQPRRDTFTTAMKSTDSILNLGTQESLSEPKHLQLVDVPEKLDRCSLIELRKPGTQKKRKRCLFKKGKASLMKLKLQGPRDRGKSALLQGLSGQEQTTRGKMHKHCMKEEQQSSNPQKSSDSLGESAKEELKAVEQDFSTQAVEKLKTNQNTSEDSKEEEYHYTKSPPVATLGETQSKSFPCHPVRRKCGVWCEKANPRIDQIKCLQSFSGTIAEKVRNVSAKCYAECCRNALNHCDRLLCATQKNPFVRLEACSYINKFVKSSANGTTSSYNLGELFHVTQDKRKHVFPDGTVEQSDVNCITSEMQNESYREKRQNREGCFSCCQSESSNSLRQKRQKIGRKPRNNKKITEKSTMQNIFTGVVNECSECELQTEGTVAMSSSFTVSGLSHKEFTQSASCGHTSDLHAGKKTLDVQKRSIWKKSDTEILAFEGDFKKISELSVMAKGENSNNVAHHSADLASLGVLAQVHEVSNSHKSRPYEKMKKGNRKLQLLTCQRAVPMTGKNTWPYESCARTSAWVHKKHRPVSERRRLLRADCEESPGESSVKAVEKSPVTGQLGHLDLYTSSSEINKESTCQITDKNSLTSLETSEYSAVDTYATSKMSHENTESLVNSDKSAVAFNQDDEQDVKATLKFTTKLNKQEKRTVAKRSLSVTVQVDTSRANADGINCSRKVSLVSALKPMKAVNSRKLKKFKIPSCRNKPKSRKLESGHSFERETCSPLEVLDSSSVSRRQETDEETFLVNAKQQPLPVVSYATSPASMKQNVDDIDSEDFKHDRSEDLCSENLSNEMSALHEHFSSYPHSFLDRPLEPSVLDFCVTEHVLKPSFPDASWNTVDSCIALEINSDSKSGANVPQHKSQNFPDILEAYKKDVLVIDVIQDDPDLFGTKNEKELGLVDSENCPLEAAYAGIGIKDEKQDLTPEYPVISENRQSVGDQFRHTAIQESRMLNDTENSCDWALKAKDTETHQSSRGSSLLGGVTEDFLEDGKLRELDEFLKSFDVDEKLFADGVPDIKHEKKDEAEKSDCKYKDLVNYQVMSGLPQYAPNYLSEASVMKPQTNDYRFSGKSSLMPLRNYGDEPWKVEQNAIDSHSVQQILEAIELPRKYCKFYFMTLRGCSRAKCWFRHVPEQGDEKICMAILRAYINIKESVLLKRAVQIFVKYYTEVTPGMDFASQVLNELLISLLKSCLLQEVFQILNVTVQIHTLPSVDVLLKIFEHVASLNIRDAVPTLISTFRKLMDAGMLLELEHFDYVTKFLQQMKVCTQEINTVLNIKSRIFQERYFDKNWLFDFNLAVAEIQHCKEKSDWTKLGALYVNGRTGCELFDDLQKFSSCIAEILTKDSETDRPGVPFCDFADAVIKKLPHNEADRIFIGRTGISVMYSYHKVQQWTKGRKVLDKLHELQIHFTVLKGLTDAERLASRCQIVNKAAEIFLKTGSLEGATWVLRESEWTTNAPLWPCDKTDILDRHRLLCTLAHEYLAKSLYRQAFEVLQNLPGFQNHSDAIDISQYSHLFNKLINACFESKNLGVSSSAVDFMLSKNIAIDFFLLRGLITALGRSSLWSKARTYYKNALSMGCYPPLQGNLYHKRLMIPSYLSEIEMLLAIEVFLVSNASDIQSPMATSQTLQIILKRCEDPTVQNNSDYQAAVERLILAARISDPKLLLKHMTMNVNMDGVYSLELASALKWLQENMKWAGKKFHVLNRTELQCGRGKQACKDEKSLPKNKSELSNCRDPPGEPEHRSARCRRRETAPARSGRAGRSRRGRE